MAALHEGAAPAPGARDARSRRRWLLCAVPACVLSSVGVLLAMTRAERSVPSYAEARAVVDRHCLSCHSERPTVPAFPIAPRGVTLDTAAELRRHAARVRIRTAVERTMPLLDKTRMTEGERAVLARWVEGGARGP